MTTTFNKHAVQIKIDKAEAITLYKDGNEIKSILRKTYMDEAKVPIYSNFSLSEEISFGFSSDGHMQNKIFNVEVVTQHKNIPIGAFLIRNPSSLLELIDIKKNGNELFYSLKDPNRVNEDLLFIPSEIILTSNTGKYRLDSPSISNIFPVIAKENALLRY